MKLQATQIAPDFTMNDSNGNALKLKALRGKKILLTFYRHAGCAVCNLRFHELRVNDEYFKANNLAVIAVYESSEELLKKYTENEKFYAIMIADPQLELYEKYDVERSTLKLISSIFKGIIGKAKAGEKLYKTKLKHDGHPNMMGAEFLIDGQGKIINAHYNQFIGDDIPIDTIKSFAAKQLA